MGVEHLPGADAHQVVGAAGRQPSAVAFGGDQGGAGLVGERAAVQQVGEGQRLGAAGHHDVVQPGVGGDLAGPVEFGVPGAFAAGGQVVEGDREQPLPGPRAVAERGAGHAGQSRGEQREGGGGAPAGQVGADPGGGRVAGIRYVARLGEPGAHRLHQCLAHAGHRLPGVGGRPGTAAAGQRGARFVAGDLRDALAQGERVARREAVHVLVRRAGAQCLGCVGAGEAGGQVGDVQARLDQVGERQRGGGVGGAAGPRGVEDRAGAGQVADDGDASAYLEDRGVAAGPHAQVAQRAAAGRVQPDAQRLVGGAALAEHRESGGRGGAARFTAAVAGGGVARAGGVGLDDPDLVRTPVADRPQRIGVVPQRLSADRQYGPPGHRGRSHRGAAPSHQPPHRSLHRRRATGPAAPLLRRVPPSRRGNMLPRSGARGGVRGRGEAPGPTGWRTRCTLWALCPDRSAPGRTPRNRPLHGGRRAAKRRPGQRPHGDPAAGRGSNSRTGKRSCPPRTFPSRIRNGQPVRYPATGRARTSADFRPPHVGRPTETVDFKPTLSDCRDLVGPGPTRRTGRRRRAPRTGPTTRGE